jgi:hypothetical protein
MASRIAHYLDFPNYSAEELCRIATLMRPPCTTGSTPPVPPRSGTMSGGVWRNRLFAARATGPIDRTALQTISAEDICASRVFRQ